MKKLQSNHYIILLAIIVAIVTVIVALTLGKDLALSVFLTGLLCLAGLIIGTVVRKKTEIGKAVDGLIPKARRQLTTYLITGAVLTMAGIVLLVLYLK